MDGGGRKTLYCFSVNDDLYSFRSSSADVILYRQSLFHPSTFTILCGSDLTWLRSLKIAVITVKSVSLELL